MVFPEDFMGGPTPLPLSTDQSETRWCPTQNTRKCHNRLLCRAEEQLPRRRTWGSVQISSLEQRAARTHCSYILSLHGHVSLCQLHGLSLFFGARKDGTGMWWWASVLLYFVRFCFSPYFMGKMTPVIAFYLIFIAILFCLIHSTDPRCLNSQNPWAGTFLGRQSQPKPQDKTQFLVCWKGLFPVLSSNHHRTCLSNFVPYPVHQCLPAFLQSTVNLTKSRVTMMQIKTEQMLRLRRTNDIEKVLPGWK